MSNKKWAGRVVTNARKYWEPYVRAGIKCSKCGKPILPGQSWHVDHLIPRDSGGMSLGLANTWPAHAGCNTSAGGKRGAQITNERRLNKKDLDNEEKSRRARGIRGV